MSVFQEFRYCPRCQVTLASNDNYVKCDACGFQFYDNPRAGTMLLLQNQNDEYLLFRRAEEPHKGTFDLPGGFVADGETFLDGARRELQEEANVEVGALTYFGSYPDSYFYKGVAYSTLCVAFKGYIRGDQTPEPSDELAEYKFFKLTDVPIAEISFSAVRQAFTDLGFMK